MERQRNGEIGRQKQRQRQMDMEIEKRADRNRDIETEIDTETKREIWCSLALGKGISTMMAPTSYCIQMASMGKKIEKKGRDTVSTGFNKAEGKHKNGAYQPPSLENMCQSPALQSDALKSSNEPLLHKVWVFFK